MKLTFPVTILEVYERKLNKHVSGHGNEALFQSVSAGWYVRFDDYFSIYVGKEKPDFRPNQQVRLTLEPYRED